MGMVETWLGASLQGLWTDMSMPSFWVGVLQIIWIDLLLAGDNAVVIALACRGLPKHLRVWGLVLGAGAAVVMRILFTLVVVTLMDVPYLKIVGGLALFYIAVKLLLPEPDSGHDESKIASTKHLWQAVRIIVVADVVMSLDNVIAIAGASQGNVALFALGLAASIPLVILGARLMMALLARFPVLVWAGGALLGWIAGQVIATDPVVQEFLLSRFGPDSLKTAEIVAIIVGAVFVVVAGLLLRRQNQVSETA